MMMEMAMTNLVHLGMRAAKSLLAITLPVGAAIVGSLVTAGPASAQTYPSKLIKVIGQVPSGSVLDVSARLIAPALSARLGVPVVIENRPGGGGTVGAREVARSAPDGYTLLFGGVNHVIASKGLDYDPVKDFAPIATVATHHWVLVVAPSTPARSLKELIDHAKANPGKLNWGFGQGSAPQMFGEMFKAATGIVVGDIPYKSGTQALPDMLGGRIDMNFGTISNLLPLIREGKLRALAVTSEVRSPDLPDIPTMAESGFARLTRGAWMGLWAPAGTPSSIVTRLNAEINSVVTTSTMTPALKKLGFDLKIGSSQEFAAFILDEIDAWTPAAKAAGILPK